MWCPLALAAALHLHLHLALTLHLQRCCRPPGPSSPPPLLPSSSPPLLLPSFLRLPVRRPDTQKKLALALTWGGVRYVDLALEVPGLWYYYMGKDAGASAAAGGRRRRPDSFYPSMHTHGGGTFKVRTSAAQRQRLLESCPMPSYRRGHSLRGLVEAVRS